MYSAVSGGVGNYGSGHVNSGGGRCGIDRMYLGSVVNYGSCDYVSGNMTGGGGNVCGSAGSSSYGAGGDEFRGPGSVGFGVGKGGAELGAHTRNWRR